LLAKALFSAGAPFALVDNPLIIQFFQRLQPSFKLPDRRKLEEIRVREEVPYYRGFINEGTISKKANNNNDNSLSKGTTLTTCTNCHTLMTQLWRNYSKLPIANSELLQYLVSEMDIPQLFLNDLDHFVKTVKGCADKSFGMDFKEKDSNFFYLLCFD